LLWPNNQYAAIEHVFTFSEPPNDPAHLPGPLLRR
jgi:hypothetical protein